MRSLPLFHRIAGQPVIVLGRGDAAEAKRALVTRAGGLVIDEIEDGIDRGARLAFVAIENDRTAQAEALRLRCRGILVNVVDRPALCDFTVPSLLERDPVLIAIGTSGASAGLAKALRLRLEGVLPQSLGALAEALQAARDAMRVRFATLAARRQAMDAALMAGGMLDPLEEASASKVEAWLAGAESDARSKTIEFRLTTVDPDDLTLRQARLLGSADTILHDETVPEAILGRARADAIRRVLPQPRPMPAGLTLVLRSPG